MAKRFVELLSAPLPRQLSLGLAHLRWAHFAAFIATLLYYVATSTRDHAFFDSSELALVACQSGLGHPIGQPLHTIFGALFCKLPMAPLFSTSLLSAIPGALLLLPLANIVHAQQQETRHEKSVAVFLFVASLHTLLWEPSTRVEVYALASFFAFWAFSYATAPAKGRANWFFTALLVGLAAATHPVVGVVGALSLAPLWLFRLGKSPQRHIGRTLGGGLCGLLPYVYVPLVAWRAPQQFVWGAPQDWPRLKHYFGGLDYSHNAKLTWPAYWEHWLEWLTWSLQNGVAILFMLAIAAWLLLGRRQTRFVGPFIILTIPALLCANTIFKAEISDYLGYLIFASALAVAGLAVAISRLTELLPRPAIVWALLSAALFALTFNMAPSPFERNRQSDTLGTTMIDMLFEQTPENAIVLVESDHWVAPLLFEQEVHLKRPDLVLIGYGLASSSWYWEHVFALHPSLTQIPLRGPGGKVGRVHRLLRANANRDVAVERVSLGLRLKLPAPCTVGLFGHYSNQCNANAPTNRRIDDRLRQHGKTCRHDPVSAQVLLRIAQERSIWLHSIGQNEQALSSLAIFSPNAPIPSVGGNRGPRLPTWPANLPDSAHAIADEEMSEVIAAEIMRSVEAQKRAPR